MSGEVMPTLSHKNKREKNETKKMKEKKNEKNNHRII